MLIALEKDFYPAVTGSIQMVPGIGDRLLVGATVHTAAAGGMSPDTRQRQEAWAQNSWLPC